MNPLDTATKFYHLIECPECKQKQVATGYETLPHPTFVHECRNCGYTIMESEWNKVKDIMPSAQLIRGSFIEQVPLEQQVRALSWNQPYGSLMFHGKQETRNRATKVRGWVVICTCKKFYSAETIRRISGENCQTDRVTGTLFKDESVEKLGYAIGIGKLYNCRPMTEQDEDITFVQYRPGLFVWEFRNVHRIKPLPWRGKQGWSIVDNFFTLKQIEIL